MDFFIGKDAARPGSDGEPGPFEYMLEQLDRYN